MQQRDYLENCLKSSSTTNVFKRNNYQVTLENTIEDHFENSFKLNAIINAFESDKFQETFKNAKKQEILSTPSLVNQLNDLIFWLNNGFIPLVHSTITYYSPQENENCGNKILYITEKLTQLAKFFRRNKQTRKPKPYSLFCEKCNQNVVIPRQVNFLTAFEQHEHFQTSLQKYFGKLESLKSTNLKASENCDIQDGEQKCAFLKQIEMPKFKQIENDKKKQTKIIKKFAFNFEILYDNKIRNVLYPQCIIDKVREIDKIDLYTIQIRGPDIICCLLCQCNIPLHSSFNSVFEHVAGYKHNQQKKKNTDIDALKIYQETWMRQDFDIQVHQTHFFPYKMDMINCLLCCQFVYYKDLIEHIQDVGHRKLVLALDVEKKKKINLIDYQSAAYKSNTTVNNTEDGILELTKSIVVLNSKLNSKVRRLETDNATFDNESSTSANAENTNLETSKIKNRIDQKVEEKSVKNKHLIVKSVLKIESGRVDDLLENRFLPHLSVIKQENNNIICTKCNYSFIFNMYLLHQHILSKEHQNASGIKIMKYRYFCGICKNHLKSQEQWIKHLAHEHHIKKCSKLELSRKSALTEYECKTCKFVFYGDEITKEKHIKESKIPQQEKEIFLSETAKALLQSDIHITSEAFKMVENAKKVLNDQQKVDFCCKRIEAVLSKLYTKCTAYPFGSRISGLTSDKNSDLDVFVDIGDMYNGEIYQDSKSQEDFIKICSRLFYKKKNDKEFTDINAIPTARTPIIQVYHQATNIDCDLSFKNGLSVENTKFLTYCIQIQPITQALILYLKEWSKASKINDKITTYAISMLAIFFLQSKGYLLSVVKLKQIFGKITINGWEAIDFSSFTQVVQLPQCNMTLKQLLLLFFEFYANFDFDKQVVCPLLGRYIPKSCFIENGHLPLEMIPYVKKIQISDNPEIFRALSPLCIQDPFDLSHNLTKACSTLTMSQLKVLFILSLMHLKKTP